jgi:hypothetical protein
MARPQVCNQQDASYQYDYDNDRNNKAAVRPLWTLASTVTRAHAETVAQKPSACALKKLSGVLHFSNYFLGLPRCCVVCSVTLKLVGTISEVLAGGS